MNKKKNTHLEEFQKTIKKWLFWSSQVQTYITTIMSNKNLSRFYFFTNLFTIMTPITKNEACPNHHIAGNNILSL